MYTDEVMTERHAKEVELVFAKMHEIIDKLHGIEESFKRLKEKLYELEEDCSTSVQDEIAFKEVEIDVIRLDTNFCGMASDVVKIFKDYITELDSKY